MMNRMEYFCLLLSFLLFFVSLTIFTTIEKKENNFNSFYRRAKHTSHLKKKKFIYFHWRHTFQVYIATYTDEKGVGAHLIAELIFSKWIPSQFWKKKMKSHRNDRKSKLNCFLCCSVWMMKMCNGFFKKIYAFHFPQFLFYFNNNIVQNK